jgi:hypothetical protein
MREYFDPVRAAKAMGYRRCITYTQEGETGASLKGAERVEPKRKAEFKGE